MYSTIAYSCFYHVLPHTHVFIPCTVMFPYHTTYCLLRMFPYHTMYCLILMFPYHTMYCLILMFPYHALSHTYISILHVVSYSYFHTLQVVHQLIELKQSEIRKVHPGLTCFSDTCHRIEIKDIPGICKL